MHFRSRLAAWIGTIIAVFITVAMKNLLFFEQGDAKVLYSTGEKVKEVQILGPLKSGSLLVIVLSCPLIGSLSSSAVKQRPAQNNYYTELEFGVPGFVFLKLCYLYRAGIR